jgi:hypothetical protein
VNAAQDDDLWRQFQTCLWWGKARDGGPLDIGSLLAVAASPGGGTVHVLVELLQVCQCDCA